MAVSISPDLFLVNLVKHTFIRSNFALRFVSASSLLSSCLARFRDLSARPRRTFWWICSVLIISSLNCRCSSWPADVDAKWPLRLTSSSCIRSGNGLWGRLVRKRMMVSAEGFVLSWRKTTAPWLHMECQTPPGCFRRSS